MARIVAASLLAAALLAGCAAPVVQRPPPDPAALLERLASRDAAGRSEARRGLLELGDSAEALLRSRLDYSGVELRGRIADVLLAFEEKRASRLRLELVGEYRLTGGRPTALAFNADGSMLAAGSECGGIVLWDTRTHFIDRRIEAFYGWVTGLAFSPDGKRLAVSAGNEASVWDLLTSCRVARFHASQGSPIVWSRDGRWIAFADDSRVSVVEAATLRLRASFDAEVGTIERLRESTRPGRLLAASRNGAVLDLDAERGASLPWTTSHGRGCVLSLDCLPDGTRVELFEDGQLQIGARCEQAPPSANRALVMPDGKGVAILADAGPVLVTNKGLPGWLATGGVEGFLDGCFSSRGDLAATDWDDHVWLFQDGRKFLLEGLPRRPAQVVLSRDGRSLAIAGDDSAVFRDLQSGVADTLDGRVEASPDVESGGFQVGRIDSFARRRNPCAAELRTWSPRGSRRWSLKRDLTSAERPLMLSLSPDARTAEMDLRFLDLASRDDWQGPAQHLPESRLWSPLGRYFAWTERSMDNGIEMWMHVVRRSGEEVLCERGSFQMSISFNATETAFAWSNGDQVKIVSLPDFKVIAEGDAGNGFAFVGDRLAVTGDHGKLSLWFVPTMKKIADWPQEEFWGVSSSFDGRTFAIRTPWTCRVYRLED